MNIIVIVLGLILVLMLSIRIIRWVVKTLYDTAPLIFLVVFSLAAVWYIDNYERTGHTKNIEGIENRSRSGGNAK